MHVYSVVVHLLVFIAVIDIKDGHPKLVLSILWQLMRAHMRPLLQASTFLRACLECKCMLRCKLLNWSCGRPPQAGAQHAVAAHAGPHAATAADKALSVHVRSCMCTS